MFLKTTIRFIFQNTHHGQNIEKKVMVMVSEYGDDWRLNLSSNHTYGKKYTKLEYINEKYVVETYY